MKNRDMAECPFCAREVQASLVAYGGQCPHCFGEIPGEEAPTDPGEEKRKAEQKAAAAKVQRSKRVPALIAGFLFLIPVGAALYLLVPRNEKLPVLDLDDAEYDMGEIGNLVAYAEPEVVATVEAKDAGKPKTTNPDKSKQPPGSALQQIDGSKLLSSDDGIADVAGTADAGHYTESGTRKAHTAGTATDAGDAGPDLRALTGTGGASGLEVGVSVERRSQTGVVLQDDSMIVEMVKGVVQAELPKLRWQCYERRLKTDESLAGSWRIDFTVKANGTVADVAASGADRDDAELETCIAEKVKSWSFQPIKSDLPVAKTVTFKPR